MHPKVVLEAIAEKVDIYESVMGRCYFEAKINEAVNMDPELKATYIRRELNYEEFSHIGDILEKRGVLRTEMVGQRLLYFKI